VRAGEGQKPTNLSVSSGQKKMEDGLNVCNGIEGRIGTLGGDQSRHEGPV